MRLRSPNWCPCVLVTACALCAAFCLSLKIAFVTCALVLYISTKWTFAPFQVPGFKKKIIWENFGQQKYCRWRNVSLSTVGTRREGAWSGASWTCPVQRASQLSVASRCWRCLKDTWFSFPWKLKCTHAHNTGCTTGIQGVIVGGDTLAFCHFCLSNERLLFTMHCQFFGHGIKACCSAMSQLKAALTSAVCWRCYHTGAFFLKSSDKTKLSGSECIKLVAPGSLPLCCCSCLILCSCFCVLCLRWVAFLWGKLDLQCQWPLPCFTPQSALCERTTHPPYTIFNHPALVPLLRFFLSRTLQQRAGCHPHTASRISA